MRSNTSISYSYDHAGQLGAITGEGYAVTVIASGMKYRAWGDLKELTYGNGRGLNTSYSQRRQLQQFDMLGVAGTTNEYHLDGRLKYSHDIYDSKNDRSYAYDHKSRIKEALSGSEARGLTVMDGPYRETFQYDPWNNLVGRTTRLKQQTPAYSATYGGDNRNTAWSYDAAGGVTHDDTWTSKYDAAGLAVNQSRTRRIVTQIYDGDRLVSKQTQENPHCHTSDQTYYLRSSVLGGKVVVSLDRFGNKVFGSIYSGNELLAIDTRYGGFYWQHRNPATGTSWQTNQQGTKMSTVEVDPAGGQVGGVLEDDGLDCEGDEHILPMHLRLGDPEDLGSGCTLDWGTTPCSVALKLANNESARILPSGQIVEMSMARYKWRFNDSLGGEDACKNGVCPDVVTVEDPGGYFEIDGYETMASKPAMRAMGYFKTQQKKSTPQNPAGPGERPMSPEDIARLKSDMEYLLTDENCMSFVNNLVTKAMEQNPQQTLAGGLGDVFDTVQAQTNGGYFWAANVPGSTLTGGAGGYAQISLKWNNAKTVLGDATFYSSFRTADDLRVIFAVGALHETIHQMTGLDDTKLSIALATIRGEDLSQAKGSLYWGQPLDNACATALKAALRKPGAKPGK